MKPGRPYLEHGDSPMPKARKVYARASRTATPGKPNPDATLLDMIKRCAALWRESKSLDEREAKLLRHLKSIVGEEAFTKHLVGWHFTGTKKRPPPETREVGRLLAERERLDAQGRRSDPAT